MELTILLSKVFGIYLVIGGLAYMVRQRYFMSVVHNFVMEKALRLVVAVAELVAGLFIITSHNTWDSTPEILVSLIGWIIAVEGAFYLLMPESVVRSVVKVFNVKAWYIVGGIVSIVAGAYLANYGFALL